MSFINLSNIGAIRINMYSAYFDELYLQDSEEGRGILQHYCKRNYLEL